MREKSWSLSYIKSLGDAEEDRRNVSRNSCIVQRERFKLLNSNSIALRGSVRKAA